MCRIICWCKTVISPWYQINHILLTFSTQYLPAMQMTLYPLKAFSWSSGLFWGYEVSWYEGGIVICGNMCSDRSRVLPTLGFCVIILPEELLTSGYLWDIFLHVDSFCLSLYWWKIVTFVLFVQGRYYHQKVPVPGIKKAMTCLKYTNTVLDIGESLSLLMY